MPTNERVRVFATGQGSYSRGVDGRVLAQALGASATYNTPVFFAEPYVSGILPGWSIGQKPVQGTAVYGVVRSVYLTPISNITGAANGATLTIQIYRSGSSAATLATLAFTSGTVTATAFTPKLIPVSTTLANVQVRFNDLLVFRWAQGTTGLALPESYIHLDLV